MSIYLSIDLSLSLSLSLSIYLSIYLYICFAGLKPKGAGRSKSRRQESQLASGTQQPKTKSVRGRQ